MAVGQYLSSAPLLLWFRLLGLRWQMGMGGIWLPGSFRDLVLVRGQRLEWLLVRRNIYFQCHNSSGVRANTRGRTVNDLFFDYERGQKLGLWVLAIDSGLLLGPTCKCADIPERRAMNGQD